VSLHDAQSCAIIISALVAAGSLAVAAGEFAVRRRQERAASDVQLARLFSDLVLVADGFSRPAELPDGLAAALLEAGVLKPGDFEPPADGSSQAGKVFQAARAGQPIGKRRRSQPSQQWLSWGASRTARRARRPGVRSDRGSRRRQHPGSGRKGGESAFGRVAAAFRCAAHGRQSQGRVTAQTSRGRRVMCHASAAAIKAV
jgi:hypothetical protein